MRKRHVLLLPLFLGALYQVAVAALGSTSVTPTSLAAGDVSDVVVAFTSAATIPVGSSIVVGFPAGFQVSAGTVLTVTSASSTTTLSVTAVTTTQITASVQANDIDASFAFRFTASAVTNPTAGTTSHFSIQIQDSGNNVIDSDGSVSPVMIASQNFSSASVQPDSLNAGVAGTATVSFTTAVGLPVGSVIVVTFPSVFSVSSTTISSTSNVNSNSAVSMVGGSEVHVTVASSAVSAGAAVSFKLNGITNPGATTTGVFLLSSQDASGGEFQHAQAIGGVTLASTQFSAVSIELESNLAGVATTLGISVELDVGIMIDGKIELVFPNDFDLVYALNLLDAVDNVLLDGAVANNTATFNISSPYSAGSHFMNITIVENPG